MTAAAFRYPWLGLVAVAATVAVAGGLWGRWRHARRARWRGGAPITNVAHATASAVFAGVRRRYRVLIGAELALLAIVGLGSAVLAMRPLGEHTRERQSLHRDVMLCLDVSGSMKELDKSILQHFVGIAAGLPGDRIGLTVWNGSAVTVFPLTDDHGYVAAILEFAADDLDRGGRALVRGTELGGSSLIGDGLASCVMRFDRLEEERARSIVLATDNKLAGSPIVTLEDAAAVARERDIRVYALAPARYMTYRDARELEEAVLATGGAYVTTDDMRLVDEVIDQITEMEATHLDLPAEVVLDDRPGVWATMALAGIGLAGTLAWRLRR